jgi:hypothetical protein
MIFITSSTFYDSLKLFLNTRLIFDFDTSLNSLMILKSFAFSKSLRQVLLRHIKIEFFFISAEFS